MEQEEGFCWHGEAVFVTLSLPELTIFQSQFTLNQRKGPRGGLQDYMDLNKMTKK